MLLAKYEKQLGDGKGLSELVRKIRTVTVAAVNDIGMLAVNERCPDSLNFLMEEALVHREMEVRRVAVDYLCDIHWKHPLAGRVAMAVNKMIAKEDNKRLKEFATGRLRDFQARSLKKKISSGVSLKILRV